jgi:hypothetical protein
MNISSRVNWGQMNIPLSSAADFLASLPYDNPGPPGFVVFNGVNCGLIGVR